MARRKPIPPPDDFGTVQRLGKNDALDVTVDGTHVATIERGKGKRFQVRVSSKSRLGVKRRKRQGGDSAQRQT